MAQRQDLVTFLEIGSSGGGGSTLALVEGMLKRARRDCHLYCMELSRTRYHALFQAYRNVQFVHPYNISSVSTSDFPPLDEIKKFYDSRVSNFSNYDWDFLVQAYQTDLKYIEDSHLNYCGISFVKDCNKIKNFDFVLIDGSEFTGEAELNLVWGARVIALDDINTHKNFINFHRLKMHHGYRLTAYDATLRNGFAIFEKF